MDNQNQQLIARLKEANNVLVTVSRDPSVDQLAAALGLTLALNRLKKHATAVFSGKPPSVMEFLEADKTFEKNTDSLRDFIISLDRSKADKLRYKVEDTHVRIYISPYRTSIHQDDLQFSQGEANVDVVVALGVHEQNDLDQAIVSHGKILHDATIATVNIADAGTVGSIHVVNTASSSLSEMVAQLSLELTGEKGIDDRIATALLTGIVSETDRFSNDKTKPATLSVASKLMEAGANQQLVSEKLQPPPPPPPPPPPVEEPEEVPLQLPEVPSYSEEQPTEMPAPIESAPEPEPDVAKKDDDGTLHINHDEFDEDEQAEADAQIHIDDHGNFYPYDQGMAEGPVGTASVPPSVPESNQNVTDDLLPPIIKRPQSAMLSEPPSSGPQDGGELGIDTSSSEADEEFFDPLSVASKRNEKILQHGDDSSSASSPQSPQQSTEPPKAPEESRGQQPATPPPPPIPPIAGPTRTLQDIERSVGAHQEPSQPDATPQEKPAAPSPPPELDDARNAIINAMNDPNENASLSSQPNVQNPQQPPPVPPPMMPPQS